MLAGDRIQLHMPILRRRISFIGGRFVYRLHIPLQSSCIGTLARRVKILQTTIYTPLYIKLKIE